MSTTIALLHKHYDKAHLAEVRSQMEVLGAPVIKAVWQGCWGIWVALEGCHRLRAAHAMGIDPVIEEVEYSDDEITLDSGDVWRISEIVDRANDAYLLDFRD